MRESREDQKRMRVDVTKFSGPKESKKARGMRLAVEASNPPIRTPKKVAIIGFADSWKLAPWDDPTVEIWSLNEFHKYAPRWDRWFEQHDGETIGITARNLDEGEQKRHLEWLKAQPAGKPIYMQAEFCNGQFPAAVEYPLKQMIDTFGRYFTSTIGYMLALAIDEGYEWIGLYGVDLASDVEYPGQRPNTEYLVGIARGKGITVEIAKTSALLRSSHLYGYEKPPQDNKLLTAMKGHRGNLEKRRDEAIATLNTLDGAIQECDNIEKYYAFTARGCQIETF